MANGEGAHYPMLTFALATIAANFPDQVNDIGFFGQPGNDAESAGATIWMPAGLYIPQTTSNLEVALDFVGFVTSVEATEAMTNAVAPTGSLPY
ncbi:MAG UNVERIFIED_CONTAM: hypothetical protein LVT10_20130 [Anaerolineae bacterium]